MLTKAYTKTGRSCRVTFEYVHPSAAKTVALCGEFNQWDPTTYPMRKRRDGSFHITISLEPGRDYRFKYLVDGQVWENDAAADGYVPNEFGTDDSVVSV